MPSRRSTRVSVQQKYSWSRTAMTDEDLQPVAIDYFLSEVVEHVASMPATPTRTRKAVIGSMTDNDVRPRARSSCEFEKKMAVASNR